jgi:outer membrane protein TolC
MSMTRVFLALGAIAAAGPLYAETLVDAWASVSSSHREIAAASARHAAARYELDSARAARIPQLGIASGYTHMDRAPGFSLSESFVTPPIFDGDDFIQASAQVSVPLYAGGSITSSIKAAEFGAGAAADELQTIGQDIRLGVAKHYVAVLRAESAVDVARSNVASLEAHTADTQKRLEFGAVPQNDYLAASTALANAKQRLLQAENMLDFSRASYNRYLNRPLDGAVTLDPSPGIGKLVPDDLGLDGLVSLAQSQRRELSSMALRVRALQEQSQASKASARPQVELSGGYMFAENEFLDDDSFWMASLSVRWNLFDGGRSRKQAAAISSQASALTHLRADLESMIALEVRRAWNDRNEAANRMTVARQAIDQAMENLRVVRNRYAAGASTNSEVLDAETLREQSLGNRDNARYDFVLARLRLARAVGNL